MWKVVSEAIKALLYGGGALAIDHYGEKGFEAFDQWVIDNWNRLRDVSPEEAAKIYEQEMGNGKSSSIRPNGLLADPDSRQPNQSSIGQSGLLRGRNDSRRRTWR